MSGFGQAEDAEKALSARPVFARYQRKVGRELAADFLRFQVIHEIFDVSTFRGCHCYC